MESHLRFMAGFESPLNPESTQFFVCFYNLHYTLLYETLQNTVYSSEVFFISHMAQP